MPLGAILGITVSPENVELHRQAYAAFNAHDLEAFIALFDPQVEFRSAFVAVGGVTLFHGHDGLRTWNQGFEDVWGDEIRVEPEAYFDLGEQTLAFSVVYARGRQSRAETTMQLAQVYTWSNGLGVYMKSYSDRAEALLDLGVSLDDLEAIAP